MDELKIFKYEGQEVRVVMDKFDGSVWWVEEDIYNILGITAGKSKIVNNIDERPTEKLIAGATDGWNNTAIMNQERLDAFISMVAEEDVFKFKLWVKCLVESKFGTVLPTTLSEALREIIRLVEMMDPSLNGGYSLSRPQTAQEWFDGLAEHLEKHETDRPTRKQYIYGIQNSVGQIKIGTSVDPDQRLSTLQTGNPDFLELIYKKEVDDGHEEEKRLHALAARYRIHGEWFSQQAKRFLK